MSYQFDAPSLDLSIQGDSSHERSNHLNSDSYSQEETLLLQRNNSPIRKDSQKNLKRVDRDSFSQKHNSGMKKSLRKPSRGKSQNQECLDDQIFSQKYITPIKQSEDPILQEMWQPSNGENIHPTRKKQKQIYKASHEEACRKASKSQKISPFVVINYNPDSIDAKSRIKSSLQTKMLGSVSQTEKQMNFLKKNNYELYERWKGEKAKSKKVKKLLKEVFNQNTTLRKQLDQKDILISKLRQQLSQLNREKISHQKQSQLEEILVRKMIRSKSKSKVKPRPETRQTNLTYNGCIVKRRSISQAQSAPKQQANQKKLEPCHKKQTDSRDCRLKPGSNKLQTNSKTSIRRKTSVSNRQASKSHI